MNRVTLDHIKSQHDSGFCLADDYAKVTEFNDGTPTDDLELLKFVVQLAKQLSDDSAQDIISFCVENERGIIINDTAYGYDSVKHILEA